MPTHLVIHGHFYQPPRENPWTGRIERQPSAAPYHDWNARIADECYLPNARSRVLDERGCVQEIKNNYARMSWNFGPTLLAWMAQEAPEGLAALQEADRESLARLGHGNAIGQAYNHIILPLASRRDRWTQIAWGIREFAHRFGRQPDALWLAETAVDAETLALLVQAGMRYVILSPSQAARWRPQGDGRWRTPADEMLDPRRPYRWILRDAAGAPQGDRGIDVCFYNAPLSRGISFQHLLRDARVLADRIDEAAGGDDPLVLVATDGESYGHHEKFGDMCLATLFAREAAKREYVVTNPAAYLARHRPTWEVELFPASAWSCAHGVGRWNEDCGCSTGGGPGWNQAWRRPLRQGLDRLRDSLAAIFTDEATPLLAHPWAARDDYIDLLLAPGAAAREAFFTRHRTRPLTAPEQAKCLRLLEMQHQAMLMYTSCAWFFSDVSGIETIQNLRYAARAIDLAAPYASLDLEAVLRGDLGRAASNLPEHKDGRQIWERQVVPSRVPAEAAAVRLLLEGLLGRPVTPQVHYRWALAPEAVLCQDGLVAADLTATSEVTGEVERFAAAARLEGRYDFVAGVAPWPGPEAWPAFVAEARRALAGPRTALPAWAGRHAARLLGLRDLLGDECRAILTELLARDAADLAAATAALAQRAEPAAEAMTAAEMALPAIVRDALKAQWSREFTEGLDAVASAGGPAAYTQLLTLSDRARRLGLTLDLAPGAARFARTLTDRLDAIADTGGVADWQDLLDLLQLGERLGLGLPVYRLQERMLPVLQERLPALVDGLRDARGDAYALASAILAVATRLNLRTQDVRDRLTPLEEPLAADPDYWP